MGRIDRDTLFMEIAHIVAKRGTCPRAKVGAVVVDGGNRIRSIGYNGSPSGHPHCDEVGCDMEDGHCKSTIHAEMNALNHVRLLSNQEYTLYSTHYPCEKCMPQILDLAYMITRVVYEVPYRYSGPHVYEEEGIIFERYTKPTV